MGLIGICHLSQLTLLRNAFRSPLSISFDHLLGFKEEKLQLHWNYTL